MDRELVIRLAREAGLWEMLEGYANEYVCGNAEEDCLPDLERFAALVAAHERKQALAEPESDYERGFVDGMQEQMKRSVDKAVNRMAQTTHWEGAPTPRKPLTTPAPRQWVSLTEQEMYDLFFHDQYGPRLPEYLVNTIKCIEAALKEKNSGS